jgi:hypothetical protein
MKIRKLFATCILTLALLVTAIPVRTALADGEIPFPGYDSHDSLLQGPPCGEIPFPGCSNINYYVPVADPAVQTAISLFFK